METPEASGDSNMKNVSNADESVSIQTNLGESKCQQNTSNRTTMNIGV
jgi:hypothetical protein